MKYFVLLFFSISAYAGIDIDFKNEPCVSTEKMAHRYRITQKMDNNIYEAVSIFNPNLRLLIKTNKGFEFQNTGIIAQFYMRKTGVKTMKLNNGFDKGVQIYEQCNADENDLKKVAIKSKGKSASCQDSCWKKNEKKLFKKDGELESCLSQACK